MPTRILLTALCLAVLAFAAPPPACAAAGVAAEEAPAEGLWPLHPRPEVVQRFEPPQVRWGSGHRGVDLAGQVGQSVRTSLPGRVSFVGRIAGRGVVVVDHGGTRTTYEPVSASVRMGEEVTAGQRIGSLEWFGSHCFPRTCLHWGLKRGEVYLDPLSLVGGPKPIRLLPLGTSAPALSRSFPRPLAYWWSGRAV